MIRRCPTLLTPLLVACVFALTSQPEFTRADGLVNYTLTSTDGLPAATGPLPGTPSVTVTGAIATGSAAVSVPSTNGLGVGYLVTGTGIPSGTTVSQVGSGGSQITLSQSATTSGSESLVFTPNIAAPQVVALIEPVGSVPAPPANSTAGPLTILAGSQGFNQSGVYDFLNTPKDANGNLLQPIALGLSFYNNASSQGLASLANGGVLNFSLNVANQNAPPQLVSQTKGVSITLEQGASTSGSGSSDTSSGGSGGQITTENVPEPLSVLVWSALAGAGLLRSRAARKSRRDLVQ